MKAVAPPLPRQPRHGGESKQRIPALHCNRYLSATTSSQPRGRPAAKSPLALDFCSNSAANHSSPHSSSVLNNAFLSVSFCKSQLHEIILFSPWSRSRVPKHSSKNGISAENRTDRRQISTNISILCLSNWKRMKWKWFIEIQLGSSVYTKNLLYYLTKQLSVRVKNLLRMY